MRDLASCFGEYAIPDASCYSYSSTSSISLSLIPSIQNTITSLYKIFLSSQKQLLITATWSKNNNTTLGLNIHVGDDPSTAFKLNTNSSLLRKKKKGNKTFEFENSKVDVFWDLSAANYNSSPEPVDGYYVLVTVDSELGLLLGDMAMDAASKKLKTGTKVAKFSLISRREHLSGNALYSTKAQFCDTGSVHEILIRYSGENEGLKHPILSVCVDKKTVICVKRLQWNFRGNETIFVDGLSIDLLWDVHGWFFNPSSGLAVFMFRTRSRMESRLWLEEQSVQQREEERPDQFSLLIYACKSP